MVISLVFHHTRMAKRILSTLTRPHYLRYTTPLQMKTSAKHAWIIPLSLPRFLPQVPENFGIEK
jgi:hypothetical protein